MLSHTDTYPRPDPPYHSLWLAISGVDSALDGCEGTGQLLLLETRHESLVLSLGHLKLVHEDLDERARLVLHFRGRQLQEHDEEVT